jgi:hypothetical protein
LDVIVEYASYFVAVRVSSARRGNLLGLCGTFAVSGNPVTTISTSSDDYR